MNIQKEDIKNTLMSIMATFSLVICLSFMINPFVSKAEESKMFTDDIHFKVVEDINGELRTKYEYEFTEDIEMTGNVYLYGCYYNGKNNSGRYICKFEYFIVSDEKFNKADYYNGYYFYGLGPTCWSDYPMTVLHNFRCFEPVEMDFSNSSTGQACSTFLKEKIDSGEITKYKYINMDSSKYDSKIPTPKLVFDGDGSYNFKINNASDGYMIQIKGRWYTTDDFELYKENLMWKYKYNTLIKGKLSDWVVPSSSIKATDSHSLYNTDGTGYGNNAFDTMLSNNPIENRSYTGGTNAVGNYFSGYNDAMTTLKTLLETPYSAYNSPEIYIRFVVEDNGKLKYGRWCHWYSNLAMSDGSSGSNLDDVDGVSGENQSNNGLTDKELEQNELKDNPRLDEDVSMSINSDYVNSNRELTETIMNNLKSIYELVNSGDFNGFLHAAFSFIPSSIWMIIFTGVSISVASMIIVVVIKLL